MTDPRRTSRPTSSPHTSPLCYLLDDNQRTGRAQRLLVTATVCAIALFVVLAMIVRLANGVVVASGSAATVFGAVASWGAVRRRRHHELRGPVTIPKTRP